VSVDGNDAVQVYETCLPAMDNIRQRQRPFLIEAVTYRLCAHVGPGSDFGPGRRPETELEEWRSREPLGRLASRIIHERPNGAALISAAQAHVLAEVDTVFESAKRRFDEVNARVGLAAPKPPDPSRV
jgi:pyruvate dehydrogenase E1 component alpha subunit